MKTIKFSVDITVDKHVGDSVVMSCWARQHFGAPGITNGWFERTYKVQRHTYGKNLVYNDLRHSFYFYNKEHATLFALRWS